MLLCVMQGRGSLETSNLNAVYLMEEIKQEQNKTKHILTKKLRETRAENTRVNKVMRTKLETGELN